MPSSAGLIFTDTDKTMFERCRRKHIAALLLTAAGLSGLAATTGAAAATAATASEVLFVYPPEGWELAFKTRIGNIKSFEYVPKGQSTANWRELITVQIVEKSTDKGPAEIARALKARFAADCGRVRHRGPEHIKINGFLAARLYVECDDPIKTRRPGGGTYMAHEVAAVQVVQGKTDLYVIERAWHGNRRGGAAAPYGRADIWGWDGFFHEIEVCDGTDRKTPCFGLGLLSPDKADIFVSRVDPVLPYGCDYFRILTLLPDLSKPAQPTTVIPVKLGLGKFGKKKGEIRLVEYLLANYRDNRSAAVILTLSRKALAGNYRTDTAKTLRDLAAMKALLIKHGVDSGRLAETGNTRCPQP